MDEKIIATFCLCDDLLKPSGTTKARSLSILTTPKS